MLRQRREPLNPDDRKIPVDYPERRLELRRRIPNIERLVKKKEAQRRDDAAERRPDRLAEEHRLRRRQRKVAGLEILHEDAGDVDDGLEDAAGGEGGDDAVFLAGDGGDEEEADLAVVVGHVHVGEAGAIGVAEGEGRCHDVGEEDKVPLEVGEDEGDGDDRDDGEDRVPGGSKPERDVLSHEGLVLPWIVQGFVFAIGYGGCMHAT